MFAEPKKNLSYLNLLPGMQVIDMGAGTGGYAFAAADLVTKDGRVYVVDIQKDLLDKVATEARNSFRPNINVLWGDIEVKNGVKLKDGVADAIIISNVLFQVDSQYSLALEAKRLLKQSGAVMVIDWQDSFGGVGPSSSQVVTQKQAEEIFAQAGFVTVNTFDAGDHHYGIIFKTTS